MKVKLMAQEVEILEELIDTRFPAISVSTKTEESLDRIGRLLFKGLGIIRVYTKIPGRPPDSDHPYTLFEGATIMDVAVLVHRDIAASLKYARVWGSAKFDGQQVGKDFQVSDGDILEIHS